MPLIPVRAKNSPERFPFVTIFLLVANIVVYLFTANLDPHSRDFNTPFLSVQIPLAKAFAASWATIFHEPWRLLTHAFMHGNLLHLLGNMLFLGVFAPAVEGRLGHARFAGLYLFAGFLSGAFQSLVAGVVDPERYVLGASGAIMGIAGAYLYIFPFASIICAVLLPFVSFRFTATRGILFDVLAQWVVLYFFVGDLWAALSSNGAGGVANFAHIGGLLTGFGMVALLQTRRDGRRVSDARKMQAEGVNLAALSAAELNALLLREPENEKLILAYGERVSDRAVPGWETAFADALRRFGYVLSEQMNAQTLAAVIASTPADIKLPATPVLRVGTRLEKSGTPDDLRNAAQLYRSLFKQERTGANAEMGLLRYAQVMERLVTERLSDNPNEPILLYQTLLRRFPASPHIFPAQEGLKRLGAPVPDGF